VGAFPQGNEFPFKRWWFFIFLGWGSPLEQVSLLHCTPYAVRLFEAGSIWCWYSSPDAWTALCRRRPMNCGQMPGLITSLPRRAFQRLGMSKIPSEVRTPTCLASAERLGPMETSAGRKDGWPRTVLLPRQLTHWR
jgi:hypothetical protein